MKRQILLFLPIIILTVSCSRYQYLTIGSEAAKSNEAQELVVENDSFSITYNFNGPNAPVNMKVLNKLDKPVAIDWKRSSLIVNGRAVSYMPETVNISGASSGSSFAWTSNVSSSTGSFSATAEMPVDWQMIPPKSYITRTPISVTNQFFENVPEARFNYVNVPLNDGYVQKVKEAVFTPNNSPMRFKSFVIFQVSDGSAQNMITYEHEFFISGLVRTHIGPGNFMLSKEKQGNQAYIQKASKFGRGLGAVGGAILVATVAGATEAAVEAVSGKKCNNCNPCNNNVRY